MTHLGTPTPHAFYVTRSWSPTSPRAVRASERSDRSTDDSRGKTRGSLQGFACAWLLLGNIFQVLLIVVERLFFVAPLPTSNKCDSCGGGLQQTHCTCWMWICSCTGTFSGLAHFSGQRRRKHADFVCPIYSGSETAGLFP